MDKVPQKMGHQTPKWANKKLPPILFWTCFALSGFLALLLSPVRPEGKQKFHMREAGIKPISLFGSTQLICTKCLAWEGTFVLSRLQLGTPGQDPCHAAQST